MTNGTEYLGQLFRDFHDLGLISIIERRRMLASPLEDWGWRQANQLLDYTAGIQPELPDLPPAVIPDTQTGLAKRIAGLLAQPVVPKFWRNGNGSMICCNEAEWKLVHNLRPNNDAMVHTARPVIVTDGERPVAVVKNFGENSAYALETNLEYGLIRGAFSQPKRWQAYKRIPSSDHAWRMDLADLGRTKPLRFSAFALPVKHRRQMKYFGSAYNKTESRLAAMLTSHQKLRSLAEQALKGAQPVDLYLLK